MPHIIILDELQELFEQMHEYSEQIQTTIETNVWNAKKTEKAQILQASTESLCNSINAQYRTQIDDIVAAQEAMLGI